MLPADHIGNRHERISLGTIFVPRLVESSVVQRSSAFRRSLETVRRFPIRLAHLSGRWTHVRANIGRQSGEIRQRRSARGARRRSLRGLADVLRLLGLLRGSRGKGRGRASRSRMFLLQLDRNRAGPAFSIRWSESPDSRNAVPLRTLHAGVAKNGPLK